MFNLFHIGLKGWVYMSDHERKLAEVVAHGLELPPEYVTLAKRFNGGPGTVLHDAATSGRVRRTGARPRVVSEPRYRVTFTGREHGAIGAAHRVELLLDYDPTASAEHRGRLYGRWQDINHLTAMLAEEHSGWRPALDAEWAVRSLRRAAYEFREVHDLMDGFDCDDPVRLFEAMQFIHGFADALEDLVNL